MERHRPSCRLTRPVDLSTVLVGNGGPNPPRGMWILPRWPPSAGTDLWVPSTKRFVNFRDILFNPTATEHTECLGHITPVVHPVDPLFRNASSHFPCLAISVTPQRREDDLVVDVDSLQALPDGPWPPALVVRTLPNDDAKRTKAWSNTNPPYFTVAFMDKLVEHGVLHVLVDLPSVDREVDGGRLEAHHAFWRVPDNPRQGCSITELIYMPSNAPDGMYLLHLGVAPMDNDAAISRPVLYPLVGST